MKYRVSLLPEKNRKRLIGKKKAQKGRGVADVVLLLILGALFLTVVGKGVADARLKEIQNKNLEYEQKVSALQHYRDINTNLQNKLNLIEKIQVNEPSLYNFVASLGNVTRPGISIATLDCVDWKTSRVCNITGSAVSRDAFTEFVKSLETIKGVSSVNCTSYTTQIVDGEAKANFAIAITCSGGSAVVVETQPVETTEAAE